MTEVLGKIFSIILFVLVSLVFVPLIGIVHAGYGPWEKWFEKITKS